MTTEAKRCFVIMPFSETTDVHTEEYWNQHFEYFLKPMIEENNHLFAYRSEPLHGDILRQIISNLVTAHVVVADLTDYNPNVFWELGVRHSFKQSTVTIAESGTELPFDLGSKGTLFYYPNDHIKNEKFKRQFSKTIADCLLHPEAPDSPVLDTITGRGTLFEMMRRDEVVRRLEAITSEIKTNRFVMHKTIESTKKHEIIYARMQVASLQLLVTERYVNADGLFYESADTLLLMLIVYNERLSRWYDNYNDCAKWFEENNSFVFGLINDFEKKLEPIQKEVKSPRAYCL